MSNNVNNKKSKKSNRTRMAVNPTASKKMYKQSAKDNERIKAHKNQKRSSNRIKKVILTFLMIIFAVVLIFVSGAFDISEIIVEGNDYISSEQIISFSGIEKNTNIFALSKKNITNKIKENSYINDVTVRRSLPNKVKLTVDERKVEYALEIANSYIYIDKQGFVLEISSNNPGVQIISGVTTDLSNIKPNDRLNESDLYKMNTVIKIMETANANNLANLITRIDISNEKNYTIYLDTQSKIAYLGDGSDLNTRFLYIKAILKEQDGKSGEIFVNVDLNSEYVYFRENI